MDLLTFWVAVGVFMLAGPDGKITQTTEALKLTFDTEQACVEKLDSQRPNLDEVVKSGGPLVGYVLKCQKVEVQKPVSVPQNKPKADATKK